MVLTVASGAAVNLIACFVAVVVVQVVADADAIPNTGEPSVEDVESGSRWLH